MRAYSQRDENGIKLFDIWSIQDVVLPEGLSHKLLYSTDYCAFKIYEDDVSLGRIWYGEIWNDTLSAHIDFPENEYAVEIKEGREYIDLPDGGYYERYDVELNGKEYFVIEYYEQDQGEDSAEAKISPAKVQWGAHFEGESGILFTVKNTLGISAAEMLESYRIIMTEK